MKKNSSTVIEVEAEEMLPEVPLEKVIDETLVKANVTKQVLAALKEKYGNLKLKSLDDKETYLELVSARKEVRKVGIITEKICLKGREDANKIQKLWISKEKEVSKEILEVQNPIDAEIKKFEDEVDRKEQEESKKKEAEYMNRQALILKYGAKYNNGSLELNHISYEISLIKEADEEQWNDTILPKYKKVYEEIEAVRVEEENKRKIELENQRKEKEYFELQQKKFKEQQEAFAKQQKELQEQKDAHEKEQRLEQQRKYEEEKKKQQSIIDTRMNQLKGLGMDYSFTYNAMIFEDVNIDVQTELGIFNEEEWNNLIHRITPVIEERKTASNEKLSAKLEKEKKEAIELAAQQEREKIAEQQRQDELKKQQEAQRKQQELEASKDKVQWEHFLILLNTVSLPSSLKSSIYKSKLSIAKEKIEEIKNL